MKSISNLVFILALVGMGGFWAFALTGNLAPVPSAPPPVVQAPAPESPTVIATPVEKETGEQKDNQIGAASAPIEEASAPTPAKTVVSKTVKPRTKKPAQVKTKDRAAAEKS